MNKPYCYQCEQQVNYLFADGRCAWCTRIVPEVALGEPAPVPRQLRWDRRYLGLAHFVGRWSKDPSTKVGAILVRPNNSVAATGFNGFPPDHDDSAHLYADRAYKYANVIHAEVNALNFFGAPAPGFSLYTSFPCCPICVERAAKTGVTRIVQPTLLTTGRESGWVSMWRSQMEAAATIARHFGVELVTVDEA